MKAAPLAAAAAALVASTSSAALARPTGADLWRQMTEMDLEAAYVLVRDNHPAVVAEVGDEPFRRALDEAITRARGRAARVDSFEGYTATLSGFATELGDKHLWHRPTVRRASYTWPGLAMSRRGGVWKVNEDVRSGAPKPLAGATLIGCDGRDADTVASERLGGFRAVWSIEAQRIQQAPWLLIDDGNPFVARPATCEFELDGERISHTLSWRPAGPIGLAPFIERAVSTGAPGYGVRQAGGGYWISLQGLDDRALPVLEAVKADLGPIRSAPLVVLDMRGNGGGNSAYGDSLADMLMGEAYAARARTGSTADCLGPWRATPGNLKHMDDFLAGRGSTLPEEFVAYMRRETELMRAALAAGRPLSQDIAPCPAAEAPPPPPLDGRGSLLKGRMIVLTDNACFSSCLLVTDLFRRLGALHVGEATDAATRYMEVREERLPSGAGYFSVLQKVSLGSPRQIGPFLPHHHFADDIRDTKALEAWVAGLR